MLSPPGKSITARQIHQDTMQSPRDKSSTDGTPILQLRTIWVVTYVRLLQWTTLDLPRQQWSLLNRFCTEQKHCGACRRKWQLTDQYLCPCGETQTLSHIVKSCPLTKLNGGLSRLHSADEDAVSWLTSYG